MGRTLGRSAGGFLKEAPNPPQELFLNLSLTEPTLSGKATRNRCSKVNSMPPGFSRRTPQRQCQPATPGGQALAGCLLLRFSQCRKRSNAGVPGAVAPGKIILESPPSPPGKGVGGYPSPSGKGGRIKTKGGAGRRPKRQAAHANITAAGQTNTAKNKRQYRKQHAIHC